ncbi:hypothetical protein Cgig2_020371 [Carnegiea gigantea]|uniref:Uncharacterized protein n=1 Tax=Carnegiea gigantea TaxID=171969 RepID=A0A9Q1KCP1_9CARY|nr:hypothetical protein Cgig2_020371 [Carnegiea gigantea]
MDTLKSLMFAMADTITYQVAEQVKKAMDATGSAQPVPVGEPPIDRKAGHPFSSWNMAERCDRLPLRRQGGRPAEEPIARSAQGKTAVSATASTPYATHSRRTAWFEEHEQTSQPIRKYCEFHEQNGHTTTECRELKKALHELADKAQIDRATIPTARAGPRSAPPRNEEYSTEVVATIAGGYAEEITWTA